MREIFMEGIGRVCLSKNGRARKYYHFKLQPDGSVLVSIPKGGSYKHAIQAVENIKPKIIKLKEKQDKNLRKLTVFDETTEFKTRGYTIQIRRTESEQMHAKLIKNCLTIAIPQNFDILSESIQDSIRKAIEMLWRMEAKRTILPRVEELARVHGFSYQKIKITSARTRWGSCSSKNNLNFSLHLMMLPNDLVDYIILHELCHTIHKNHGPNFYAYLNKVTDGQHDKLNQALKSYRIGVY